AAVRAAVAEAEHRPWMAEHLANGLEVEAAVIEEREVEQLEAVALEEEVVRDLLGRPAGARGDRGDAPVLGRLVVGRVAEREHLLERVREERRDRRIVLDPLGEDRAAGLGGAEPADALGKRQLRDRPVAGVRREGMQLPGEPEE